MRLLVLDIETTGLRREEHDITVVALAELDTETGTIHDAHCVNLLRARDDKADDRALLAGICAKLDACDRIVAFNGIAFDLPFIAHKAAHTGAAAWNAKAIDFCAFIFEASGQRVGMAALCASNTLAVAKSASGLQAIAWAEERAHAELEEYCLQDVLVLIELTKRSLAAPLLAEVGPRHARRTLRLFFRVDPATCQTVLVADKRARVTHPTLLLD